MFNPAAFAEGGGATDVKPQEAEKKPYKTVGVSARDQVRKMFFETFTSEGSEQSQAAQAAE